MISSEREEGRVQRIKEMIPWERLAIFSFHGTLGFNRLTLRPNLRFTSHKTFIKEKHILACAQGNLHNVDHESNVRSAVTSTLE